MKKILISILTILGVGLSFCSADGSCVDVDSLSSDSRYVDEIGFSLKLTNTGNYTFSGFSIKGPYSSTNTMTFCYGSVYPLGSNFLWSNLSGNVDLVCTGIAFSKSVLGTVPNKYTSFVFNSPVSISSAGDTYVYFYYNNKYNDQPYSNYTSTILIDSNLSFLPYYDSTLGTKGLSSLLLSFCYDFESTGPSCPSCPDQEITIHYNNNQSSTTISCDGNPDIYINGLSTITSTNTFTPYYNISYKDEDNQSLIESYDKSILYLENGQFKKTYTGNNDWILTVQGGNNSNFSGYLPTFDVVFTGDSLDTGNIFNNFAENSLKFILSNIPSYIQYVIIIMLLFFILGFVRKFKRK